MENPAFMYAVPSYSYCEDVAFPGRVSFVAGPDDCLVDPSLSFINPLLQSQSQSQSQSPSSPYLNQWDCPQPMQRFLKDPQKTAFFNTELPLPTPLASNTSTTTSSKMNLSRATLGHPTFGVRPAPHPSLTPSKYCGTRFTSPIPPSEPPSSVSGASDDSSFPATPPDTTGFSIYQPHSSQYGQWNPSVHAVHITDMGLAMPTDVYVNPLDVNPASQLGFDSYDSESSSVDFLPQRQFSSFDSYGPGHCDFDPVATRSSVTAFDLTGTRQRVSSPDQVEEDDEDKQPVKDEIQAAPQPSQYPPFCSNEQDDEDPEDDQEFKIEVHSPILKRKSTRDSADSDYRPTSKKSRPSAASHSPNTRRSRNTQQSTVSQESPPARKKPRRGNHDQAAQTQQQLPQQFQQQQLTPSASVRLPSSGASSSSSSSKSTAYLACPEADCQLNHFKDQASLDAHVKKQHTRPFVCVFHFAGCPATFASKNEWKRHVNSQHLLLNYWVCQEGPCARHDNSGLVGADAEATSNAKGKGRSSTSAANVTTGSAFIPPPNLLSGAIFNRKDLYTQHLRRMHMPPQVKKTLKQHAGGANKKSGPSSSSSSAAAASALTAASHVPEWDQRVKQLQDQARQARCALPARMVCPAPGCTHGDFVGTDAWDQRMEHVARHLEKAAVGEEDPVVFGGADSDPSLLAWAARTDVAVIRMVQRPGGAVGWELNNPLKNGVSGEGTAMLAAGGAGRQAVGGFAGLEDEESPEKGGEEEDDEGENVGEDTEEEMIVAHDPCSDADADADEDADGDFDFA